MVAGSSTEGRRVFAGIVTAVMRTVMLWAWSLTTSTAPVSALTSGEPFGSGSPATATWMGQGRSGRAPGHRGPHGEHESRRLPNE